MRISSSWSCSSARRSIEIKQGKFPDEIGAIGATKNTGEFANISDRFVSIGTLFALSDPTERRCRLVCDDGAEPENHPVADVPAHSSGSIDATESGIMKRTILFLASTFPREPGDDQAPFVLEQAEAWISKRPGDRVIILAPHHPGASLQEQWGAVEIRRFRYAWPTRWQALAYPAILPNLKRNPFLALQVPAFLAAEYRAARKTIQNSGVDLVYAHWVMPQGVVAHQLWYRLGVPYVLQTHSSDLTIFGRLGKPGRDLARKLLRGAAHFFCVNESQRSFALDMAAPADREDLAKRTTVLPMGVGTDVPCMTENPATPEFAVGTIARLSRKKGIDLLISAAETLAGEGRRIPIGIAGDGEDREQLASMPRSANITFTGFLSGSEKARFFNRCRTMVFSSVAAGSDVEGLPVALLEALAAGKPIIATRDTNIEMLPEWTEISDAVILLDDARDTKAFARALASMAGMDAATLSAHTTKLRRVMGRYRWDKLINEYLDAVERTESLQG